MTKEAMRKQVKKYIDKADENSVRRVDTILETDQQDFWDTLPQHVKEDVEAAFLQSERGEGEAHEEVMKKYRNLYVKY